MKIILEIHASTYPNGKVFYWIDYRLNGSVLQTENLTLAQLLAFIKEN